jgi:hypothetical protein
MRCAFAHSPEFHPQGTEDAAMDRFECKDAKVALIQKDSLCHPAVLGLHHDIVSHSASHCD